MRDARIPEPVLEMMGKCQKDLHRKVPGAASPVLAGLYLHADAKGTCWPGTKTLEELTGFDRSTVIRAVNWLVAHGFVLRRKTRGKANVYQLPVMSAFGTSGVGATSETDGLVASAPSTSGVGATQLVASAPPEQEELEQALNTPEPRAAEERGPGEGPQGQARSFHLPGYGEVYKRDTWALEQPDSRGHYLKTFGPKEAT